MLRHLEKMEPLSAVMRRVSSCQVFEWQLFPLYGADELSLSVGDFCSPTGKSWKNKQCAGGVELQGSTELMGVLSLPTQELGDARLAAGRMLMDKGGRDSEGFSTQVLCFRAALHLQWVKCLFFMHFLWSLGRVSLARGDLAVLGTQQAELWRWLLRMWQMFPSVTDRGKSCHIP